MDPENCIRNGFANGGRPHSHFYAACNSQSVENRHPAEENGPHTSPYLSFYGRLYGGNMCNVKT